MHLVLSHSFDFVQRTTNRCFNQLDGHGHFTKNAFSNIQSNPNECLFTILGHSGKRFLQRTKNTVLQFEEVVSLLKQLLAQRLLPGVNSLQVLLPQEMIHFGFAQHLFAAARGSNISERGGKADFKWRG